MASKKRGRDSGDAEIEDALHALQATCSGERAQEHKLRVGIERLWLVPSASGTRLEADIADRLCRSSPPYLRRRSARRPPAASPPLSPTQQTCAGVGQSDCAGGPLR